MSFKKRSESHSELIDPQLEESIENSKFYNYIKENKLDLPLIKEIDKYKIPYCYQDAINHRAATKIGIAIQNTAKICKCCSKPIEKNRKPWYKWEIKDMLFLGAGYPLYFSYLILMIKLYGFIFALNIISTYFNYVDNRCEISTYCTETKSTKISYGNRNYSTNQYKGFLLEMLNLLTIIIFIMFIEKQYIIIQTKIKQAQTQSSCPSNYTIKINNIQWDFMQYPNLANYIKSVIKQIDIKNKNVEVRQVIVCYKTERLRKYENMIEQLILQKQEYMRKYKDQIEFNNFNFNKEYKIKRVLNKLIQFKEKLKVQNQQSSQNIKCQNKYFSGAVFVIFEKQYEKQQVSQMKKQFLEQHEWYLEDAEQPNEIIWDNLNLNYKDHLNRKKKMIIFLFFILMLGLLFIYFVYKQQDIISQKFEGSIIQSYAVSSIMSLSTLIVNFVLSFSLQKTTEFLKFQNKTMKATFYIFFNSCFQIINQTLLQIIVFSIINKSSSVFKHLFFSEFGLVNTQLTTFFFSIINPIQIFLMDIEFYKKRFKKNKESRKNKSVKTQSDLQNIYEFPEFELDKFYSETLTSILVTAFYLPIAPIYSLILLIKMVLYYIVTKVMFFNRRIVKFNLGNELDEKVQQFLLASIFVFQFTWTFAFYLTHFDAERWWEMLPNIFGIISIIAYFIIKYKKVQNQNQFQKMIENQQKAVKNYSEEKDSFQTEYGRENPFTEFQEKNEFFLQTERKNRKQQPIIKNLNEIFTYKNRPYHFEDSKYILNIKNQPYFCKGVNKLMHDIKQALEYSKDLLQVKKSDGIDFMSYVNKKNRQIKKKLVKWAEKQQNLLDQYQRKKF
ncbi:transmembrane protein, putative (macronuclear) [Tetrahymena thermophila SB210]|uniref:Transmembrane protein, putative n=1 Tax=Tetrahymena thermophila (strain SB210) TaxID=312017 RepID=I7M2B8_TETTS|nr:transmembrane protein, putative [Tetrahymena thermophila SB210]EAR99706.2 transmembrane protein, putative [Tetrahymena thermophila SB210]|eukprot:XP_001019951.2 transmembrane protein, putative [Tetrahymena thermophila SB210]